MINFLSNEMFPFSVALIMMVMIGALEAASLFGGFSISSTLDNLLPDFDVDVDIDADAGAGISSASPVSHIFGWLAIGRVPSLVLIVLFLCCFGLAGYIIQLLAIELLGFMLPATLAAIPAGFLGILGMGRMGNWIARVLPQDQTSAASRKDLVGSIATITSGTATVGNPAEARATDLSGRAHYIRVEPSSPLETLEPGTLCLIVKLPESRAVYQATSRFPQNKDAK